MSVAELIGHVIELDKVIAQKKKNGEDYTEELNEKCKILDNPYYYDKYYGLRYGGII